MTPVKSLPRTSRTSPAASVLSAWASTPPLRCLATSAAWSSAPDPNSTWVVDAVVAPVSVPLTMKPRACSCPCALAAAPFTPLLLRTDTVTSDGLVWGVAVVPRKTSKIGWAPAVSSFSTSAPPLVVNGVVGSE